MGSPNIYGLAIALVFAIFGAADCFGEAGPGEGDSQAGVRITQEGMDGLEEGLAARITSAEAKVMDRPGLAGAAGGACLKLMRSGSHEVLLPIPQIAGGQAPLCFFVRCAPCEAAEEYRLLRRENGDVVLRVRLKGAAGREIRMDWSSVVLIAGKKSAQEKANPDSFRSPASCVQSGDERVKRIADSLWPESGLAADYARNIQRFIREMKFVERPLSLDALGILKSGSNGICTANANLASALLRAKGFASRTLAAIPTNSMRLEMHRVVEYWEGDKWIAFDPSSVHLDLPMKPWQSVTMARTTVQDENAAMKPRWSATPGCPYGQELEFTASGVILWGKDFFWTVAKPLALFEPDEETTALAAGAWGKFLETGTLSPGQVKAASAKSAAELSESLKSK